MSSIRTSQSERNKFLIELDLDLISIGPGELINELSQFDEFNILEWSQYPEFAVGKILFLGEAVSVLWEDFPNKIDFYSTSENTIKALEYELRKLVS